MALNFHAIVQTLTKDPALKTEGSKNNLGIKKHLSCCNHIKCLIKHISALPAQLFFKSLYYQDDITATAVYSWQWKQYFFYKFIFQYERSLVLNDLKIGFFGDATAKIPSLTLLFLNKRKPCKLSKKWVIPFLFYKQICQK